MTKKKEAPTEEATPQPAPPREFPAPGEYDGVRVAAVDDGAVTLVRAGVSATLATDMRPPTFSPYLSGRVRVILEEDDDGAVRLTSIGTDST